MNVVMSSQWRASCNRRRSRNVTFDKHGLHLQIYTKLIDILQLTLMKLMHVRIKFCRRFIIKLYYDNSI